MANQTVTTSVNYDTASISGLLDGELITINGGSVTINADTRWNQQAAVFGSITLSATAGGSLLFDGTQVWEVPFSASTGNVPTQDALGSNGVTGGTSGATGELTRVWATGSLTPATAGTAMPATGYIKLRSRTGNFQAGETITIPGGATITASSAGRRSWIHIVGRAASFPTQTRIVVPRLGTFRAEGDWYELGTTNGTDSQMFQYPVADQCPAIWIETATGSGVYEMWLNAAGRWTDGAVATDDARGRYFGCTSGGIITIAERGTNNAGLRPPSGCRVRIPNIICSNAASADYTTNVLNVSNDVQSRVGWTTTGAGSIVMRNVSANWLFSFASAFLVDIRDSSVSSFFSVANTGTTVTLQNVGVGSVDTTASNPPFSVSASYGGGSLTDVRVSRRLISNSQTVISISDAVGFTLTRVQADVFGQATTNKQNGTQSCFDLTRVFDSTMTDCVAVGGIGMRLIGFNFTVTNFRYASRTIGTTQLNDPCQAIALGGGSSGLLIEGFGPFANLSNVHPYPAIVGSSGSASGLEIRNIGTLASPYDCGTANPCAGVYAGSAARNVVLRRLYTQNTRTGVFATSNSETNVQAYNVWGDTADTQATAANNSVIRGGRFAVTTTGQSAVYGTHWMDAWVSTTAGRIVIACNEPNADSAAQCTATLNAAAGSAFTGAGSVAMTQLTDTVEWTQPYYTLGVTGFSNTAPTITGTNTTNHTLTFQWDTGSGWNGTWLALTGANLAAIGTVDPATGVRLRVRATVNTANSGNLLTYISVATTTTSSAQQIEYPLPGSIVTVSNLVPQSRVKISRVDTGALLAQSSNGAGTSVTLDVQYTGSVTVEARNASSSPAYRPWVTQVAISPASTTTVVALQEQD